MPTEEMQGAHSTPPDGVSGGIDSLENHVNLDNELLFFGESLPARTFFARSIFSYDVPEVSSLKSSFVYNYFTKDERIRPFLSLDEQIINIDSANTSDILYQVKNDKLPRYVKFSFKPARDPFAKIEAKMTTIIRDNLAQLIIEGAGSTKYHTGIELLDTGLEKNIYSMLSGSITFIESVSDKDSPLSAAGKLEKELNEKGGLVGKSKKLIIEALTAIQPEGLSFAKSDVSLEIQQTANDPLSKQTFSIKANNLFISDIFKKAGRIPDSIFQDEIRAFKPIAEEIQNSIRINPFVMTDAEFQNSVEAINITAFDSVRDRDIMFSKHEIKQLGYIIQRFEILPDESILQLAPLYANNIDSLYVIDKNVRYGGVYHYKIRTVCSVKTLIRDVDTISGALDDLVVAEFLIASEGVSTSIACTESEPPPPPTRLKARLDGKIKKPVLTWQFPVNPQRDIKRFQIFKRMSIDNPFTLIAEYDFDDSLSKTTPIELAEQSSIYNMKMPKLDFLDNDYEIGTSPIYALACVDAHGYSSHLSAQLKIKYERFRNKITTTVISGEGAPKPYPNLLLEEDAFIDAIKVSGYDRMAIFFDPEYYRVFKTQQGFKNTEIDQNFLSVNPDEPTYRLQILNIDLQKDKTVNIKLADKSGSPTSIPAAAISKNNINFEFGVD